MNLKNRNPEPNTKNRMERRAGWNREPDGTENRMELRTENHWDSRSIGIRDPLGIDESGAGPTDGGLVILLTKKKDKKLMSPKIQKVVSQNWAFLTIFAKKYFINFGLLYPSEIIFNTCLLVFSKIFV